jgi:hypothetical protein
MTEACCKVHAYLHKKHALECFTHGTYMCVVCSSICACAKKKHAPNRNSWLSFGRLSLPGARQWSAWAGARAQYLGVETVGLPTSAARRMQARLRLSCFAT